jgi:hypothetical protein
VAQEFSIGIAVAKSAGTSGLVVFGMTEERLLEPTGKHAENPSMKVSSRYVFDHCQKRVDLVGPVTEVEEEVMQVQHRFWGHL